MARILPFRQGVRFTTTKSREWVEQSAVSTIVQQDKLKKNLWGTLKQWVRQSRAVLFTSSGVAGFVLILRLSGLLQSWEWAALDQLFRLRPEEPPDDRVVIVGIDEENLRQIGKWPIPDRVMADLLRKLHALNPRVIGLDIYRDLPVDPGHAELKQVFASIPNSIGIETIADKENLGVSPPPVLSERNSVGFNNVLIDSDGKVRRNLLYWRTGDGKLHKSLALHLALMYLEAEGIRSQRSQSNPKYLLLGGHIFRPFKSNDGAYVRTDSTGYQVLANFRTTREPFRTVSISDVLANKVPPDLVRDRVVLIGSTARSIKDFFDTPFSGGLFQAPQQISGVELHANFVSQILSAARDGRSPLLNVWSEPVEWLWIFGWSWVGAFLSWKWRSPWRLAISILLIQTCLIASCYFAFLINWWIPLVPPALSFMGSAIAITGYLAHLEVEFKRSKEFLHQVIDTIPDPIFVKDKNHRWIVLNQAYCQFIGHPIEALIEKSERDFFSEEEADIFWNRDELVFNCGEACENEEKFTDAKGITHLIATKRSLHKDASGNLFLVGVIRDITERKRREEEEKRKAAELARYCEELKISEDRLRYLAYHDALTGLPNRKLFHERLTQTLEWAVSNNQVVAILFLDLDGFKRINDTQGHDIGDILLQKVAQRLTSCLRGSDTVARLGGDEFTVILPAITRKKDAAKVAEKILATLSKPFFIQEYSISITTSIGISLYPLDGEDTDTLIKQADAAMYRAKKFGKNKYEFL